MIFFPFPGPNKSHLKCSQVFLNRCIRLRAHKTEIDSHRQHPFCFSLVHYIHIMLIYVSYMHPTRIILFTEEYVVEAALRDVLVVKKSCWNLRESLRACSDDERVSFLRPTHSSKELFHHPGDDL